MKRARQRAGVNPGRREQGVSLVELVVAMLLGILLLVGAITVFMQGDSVSRTEAPAARLEETLRAAFNTLEPDIRMAGYWGLTNRSALVTNVAGPTAPRTSLDALVRNNCGVNWTANLAQSIDARDHGNYDLACPASHAAPWSDVLIIRRASASPTAPVAGKLQIQTNRQAGAIFADGVVPGSFGPPPRSATHDLVVHAYYIGASASTTDGPASYALHLQTLSQDAGGRPAIVDRIVAQGIVDLQVQFGVDTAGDNSAGVYVNPGAPELATGRVVSVRLSLAAISDHPEAGAVDGSQHLLGNHHLGPPGDQRRRIVMQKTIALRNVEDP
ncbi:MAG TPA: PilW family protein [Steroidobacteraceae bacterium]|nr:PilW family protein [Steroidobacteraceae bacterium]